MFTQVFLSIISLVCTFKSFTTTTITAVDSELNFQLKRLFEFYKYKRHISKLSKLRKNEKYI